MIFSHRGISCLSKKVQYKVQYNKVPPLLITQKALGSMHRSETHKQAARGPGNAHRLVSTAHMSGQPASTNLHLTYEKSIEIS